MKKMSESSIKVNGKAAETAEFFRQIEKRAKAVELFFLK